LGKRQWLRFTFSSWPVYSEKTETSDKQVSEIIIFCASVVPTLQTAYTLIYPLSFDDPLLECYNPPVKGKALADPPSRTESAGDRKCRFQKTEMKSILRKSYFNWPKVFYPSRVRCELYATP
jgi:hypothetical protein